MRLRASEGEEQGLGADSEEKREPASDIDIAVVDSLKVLDPNRPIREARVTPPLGHQASSEDGVQSREPTPLASMSARSAIGQYR
jgi:hypothetical protein